MKRLTIILGMYRSGTSLLAQICQCMGAYLGEESELVVTAENAQDIYLDNMEIVQANENILHLYRKEWYSLEKLEPDVDHPQITKVMKKIRACIRRLLEKSDTIVIKDPRISLILPLWEKILEELKVKIHYIWIFRNPLSVVESLSQVNGYSSGHSILLWIHYNLNILKFLNEREHLRISYENIGNDSRILECISQLLDCKLDDNLKWELNYIVKHKHHYSNYSYQNLQNNLLLNLYEVLLQNQENRTDILSLEKQYMAEISKEDVKYMDYDILEDFNCLKNRKIIIYGAGNCGKRAADMLKQLGILKYDFCDKDISKQGKYFMGGKIYSIKEVEKLENCLIITTVQDEKLQKEIKQTLKYLDNVCFLSYFALEMLWKYMAIDYTTLERKIEAYSLWYSQLCIHGNAVMAACKCPILIYQNGKVGSMTISKSLETVGIEHVHIHRFFDGNDIKGKLLLGDKKTEFIKKANVFSLESTEYRRYIKNEIKYKKIITLVRDPIAVDLARVFQWIGDGCGIVDRYFADRMKGGVTFLQSVSELAVKMQDFLFEWFDKELRTLTDIDVFSYPFDKEKGYTIITENTEEILLIKTERLSQMTDVLRDFVDNRELELINNNIGNDKAYAHIYEQVKQKIKFPREYVEHYYKNNLYMDHFYTEEEQKNFYAKWERCII